MHAILTTFRVTEIYMRRVQYIYAEYLNKAYVQIKSGLIRCLVKSV